MVHLLLMVARNSHGNPAGNGDYAGLPFNANTAPEDRGKVRTMWPKILMQLVELLPHVSRLAPLADRYFDSKATNERANEAALAAMAEGVQADLGQVAQAHLGLYRQLQEQSAQIATVGDDVRSVHSA